MSSELRRIMFREGFLLPLSVASRSAAGKTGSWRTRRPVIVYDKCKSCLLCWLYCPESSIRRVDVNGLELPVIDYEYCKGCGICSNVCPSRAIILVDEV